MQLDPSQERAVSLMQHAPMCIVTGGPGTGKSTTLRTALMQLLQEGHRVALAAPTGKAARRMAETTQYEAQTIHRLLGWTRDGWTYHEHNTLPFDVVIIDEASMIDVELGAALMAALPRHARIVFVGDANQLPSVGPGRLLADLVESDAVPIARLTHVHRAAATSWICRNAPKVLAGTALELEKPLPDFRYFPADSVDDVAATVRRVVAMPEYFGAQVLSPQRTTAAGVEALNNALQQTLNPPRAAAAEWKLGDTTIREGDRVIHTANNYTLNVFNGEVGTVLAINDVEMFVDFGDRKVTYSKGDAFSLDLAYALTIHKCQGSEFAWVVCVVHSAHSYMLTRQLFYTAITRAKVGVILIGNTKGIAVATSAKLPPVRNTALVARMRAYAENDNDRARDAGAGAGFGDEDSEDPPFVDEDEFDDEEIFDDPNDDDGGVSW